LLDLFVQLGDLAGEAIQGRRPEAVDHARPSVELYRRAGRLDGLASALNSVGWMLAQAGNTSQALPYAQEALALYR
jgi:tetratricopeptide (TPR) repeat protein